VRVAFVVQRYGLEVAGGAERHCREFAERLAVRGHDVSVLTTCARSYVDWADAYEPGWTELDGVSVWRLPILRRRDPAVFEVLNRQVAWGSKPIPLFLQREWMRVQGPDMAGFDEAVIELARRNDVVVFFTYLYNTTYRGLLVASGRVPTVLHPTIHDEAPAYLSLFSQMFRLPSVYALSTPEELELLRRIHHVDPPHRFIGVGVDLDLSGDGGRFRRECAIGDAPYLVYLGRLDPGKGSDELFDFFVAYKQRRPGDLRLVVVGDPIKPLPPHAHVVVTGHVPDDVRNDVLAGALALAQPSYFESFSMVLTEAFAMGIPALVQGNCDVLVGHARRSGAALPYRGYAEFEAAVDMLLDRPALAETMGKRGRAYVEQNYAWDDVMDRYEALLHATSTGTVPRTARRAGEA